MSDCVVVVTHNHAMSDCVVVVTRNHAMSDALLLSLLSCVVKTVSNATKPLQLCNSHITIIKSLVKAELDRGFLHNCDIGQISELFYLQSLTVFIFKMFSMNYTYSDIMIIFMCFVTPQFKHFF